MFLLNCSLILHDLLHLEERLVFQRVLILQCLNLLLGELKLVLALLKFKD